jgi:hypothetical protein
MKKLLFLCVVLLLSIGLIACESKSKTFSGSGIEVTLTEEFHQKQVLTASFYLEARNHIFMGNRESKTELLTYGINSLESYITAVLNGAGKTGFEVLTYEEDDVLFLYAYYTSKVDTQDYGYMILVMEGQNHFYTMNFGCFESKLEGNKSLYLKWAATITVE